MHIKLSYVASIIFATQYCYAMQEGIKPAFITSMSRWGKYGKFDTNAALNDAYTLKAMKLYERYWCDSFEFSPEPLIPKIIHQIWLGSPLPEKYKKFQQSWKHYHPDWTYILWTEKEIDEFGLENKEIFDKTKNLGQKSDIARYEILLRIGGLYVDTDFECLKPLDMLHHSLEFYTSCLPSSDGSLNNSLLNGLIAARPGHQILKACVARLKNMNLSQQIDDIIAASGPHYFTSCVFETLSSPCGKCVIFPASFFYPVPNFFGSHYISQSDVRNLYIHNESFAVHWWACSWMKN